MSFEALQRRAVSDGRTAVRLAQEMPAHLIAFDFPQLDGQERCASRPASGARKLEQMFTGRG
ncbi:hypothetical protein ACWDX6_21270 [Streptomyces sp. NPDC003027]